MKDFTKILRVLSDRTVNLAHTDWNWALGFLLLNRVGVRFLRYAKRKGMTLPKRIEKILIEEEMKQIQRNNVICAWLKDVNDLLEDIQIPFAFLKGSILGYCNISGTSLYQPGERISDDIDILISPKFLDQADAALKSIGFLQGMWDGEKIIPFSRREILFRRMSRGETAPYIVQTLSPEIPYIEVDINFSFDSTPSQDESLVDIFLNDTWKYSFQRGALRSLSPEKFLLHLILHQYKEASLYWMVTKNKDQALYKYYDIYLFIKNGLVNSQKFSALISHLGQENKAYAVLFWCGQLFGKEIQEFIPKPQNFDKNILQNVFDAENKEYYRWKCNVMERVAKYERENLIKKI